jgi:hypothetical protein
MTFKSAPYFWLVCDGCERSSTEGGDISAWVDEAQAIVDAECDAWFVEPGRHLCWECAQKLVCPECGDAKAADAATCADCGGTQ